MKSVAMKKGLISVVEVDIQVAQQVDREGVAILSYNGLPQYAVIELAAYEELQELRAECRQLRNSFVKAFIQEHREAFLELAK